MARSCMYYFAAALVLLCLLNQVAISHAHAGGLQSFQARHLLSVDCPGLCETRCSKASRAKICSFDCKACCKTCNCVPSGTAGNREECSCYANLKNSKGTGKCP